MACQVRLPVAGWIGVRLFLGVDITVAGLHYQIRFVDANFDLSALAITSCHLWVVAQAVLAPKFLSDPGEGLRNTHQTISTIKATTSRVREFVQIAIRTSVTARPRTATAASTSSWTRER